MRNLTLDEAIAVTGASSQEGTFLGPGPDLFRFAQEVNSSARFIDPLYTGNYNADTYYIDRPGGALLL